MEFQTKSLLNYVPFVCLFILRANVLSCLKSLRAYVPSFFVCLSAYVPIFFHTCVSHFLSCAYIPATTRKIYWGSLLYLVLLFFSGIFDLSFHSKPQNKLLLVKLHAPNLPRGVLLSQLVHAQLRLILPILTYSTW